MAEQEVCYGTSERHVWTKETAPMVGDADQRRHETRVSYAKRVAPEGSEKARETDTF